MGSAPHLPITIPARIIKQRCDELCKLRKVTLLDIAKIWRPPPARSFFIEASLSQWISTRHHHARARHP
jgi:hypothetical protein